jgi:hypothetical protein
MNYPQRWFWRQGRVTNDRDGNREFLLLHFMRWKSGHHRLHLPVPGEGAWVDLKMVIQGDWRRLAAEGFCISPQGFSSLPPSSTNND